MRLANKVALIIGGARGMDAAEAKLFSREGARVVIGDILEDEGRQTEVEINEAGGECLFIHLDVTEEADWVHAVSAAVLCFGELDILVNNAGIFRTGGVEETSGQLWDQVMDVNAKSVFLGTKAAIPEMRKVGSDTIINISSTDGLVGLAGRAAYTASKGAVRIFTKATAIQHAKDGIRCNSVHPDAIDTPMTAEMRADPERLQLNINKTPLGRIGQPEDIAYGVLFLASNESSFMTGSELVIDGGRTAQ